MEPTFLSQSNMSDEVNIRMSESVVDRIKLETTEERLLNTEQELMKSRRNKSQKILTSAEELGDTSRLTASVNN